MNNERDRASRVARGSGGADAGKMLIGPTRGRAEPWPLPAGLTVAACTTAFALNHSAIFGGINLSLADPLIVAVFALLVLSQKAILPVQAILFFLTLVAITLPTAMFLTPSRFGIALSGSAVFADLAKLAVCLLFLICGASIAALGIHMQVLRWFALGASLAAIIGITMEASGFRLDALYYSGLRYQGFMVDPNYWAVLTCSAIAVLLRDTAWKPLFRTSLIVCLTGAILLSGSKTGLIALLVFFGFTLIERAFKARQKGLAIALTSTLIAGAFLWESAVAALQGLVERYSLSLPQLSRLSVLLDDPVGAIGEGGSGRNVTWASGLEIIESSPIVGVGVGSYRAVSDVLFGRGTLAHNTYLQLAAEWGLPLAIALFAGLAFIMIRATRVGWLEARNSDSLVLRDMLMIFLIGSISLSLNNARMFWFFLGMAIVTTGLSRWRDSSRHD